MKLNKDNKYLVQLGDKIEDYTVETIFENDKGGVSFTLCDQYGRRLYCYPSSQLYGQEVTYGENHYNSFEVYLGAESPTEHGTYVGKTPILSQARACVKHMNDVGAVAFIVGIKADGSRIYI